MGDAAIPHDVLIERLQALASQSLHYWDVPEGTTARLINVSENATFLVEAPNGYKSILRIHRENYHSKNAIRCEHAWSHALHEDGGVITPEVIQGKDGDEIQTDKIDGLPGERHMVMFEHVEGHEPDEDHDLEAPFEELGEIAAKTHIHSINWKKPDNFERLIWNLDTVFGPNPTWGNWRDAPKVDAEAREVLQRLEDVVVRRLTAFGTGPDRYGLIHADMRLANLLIDDGTTRLIDFDDCGFGWFLYDFAAGISFMEDHPQIPTLKDAWVRGYRKYRALSAEEEHEIDTFVMLRRMALLAWIGTHIEVDTAAELAPTFAPVTVDLATKYLAEFS